MKELDIMKLHIPISKEAVVQAYATASPGQLEFQKRFLKFATDLNANFIEGVFSDFNIKIEVINIKVGPVITLYEVLPAPGI